MTCLVKVYVNNQLAVTKECATEFEANTWLFARESDPEETSYEIVPCPEPHLVYDPVEAIYEEEI